MHLTTHEAKYVLCDSWISINTVSKAMTGACRLEDDISTFAVDYIPKISNLE